jgi:hypothetical protein
VRRDGVQGKKKDETIKGGGMEGKKAKAKTVMVVMVMVIVTA